MSERDAQHPSGISTALAGLIALVIGVAGAFGVSMERSLGWDEAMHAGLPAGRMAVAIEAGATREAVDVALDCQQYPPAYPVLLAATAGADERGMRATGRVVWAVGLFGLFGLARATVRANGGHGRRAGLLALALGATSPLAWAYSGTLFLEAPFWAATTFALWAWIVRGEASGERSRLVPRALAREALAGALITLAFFTKFNYGLLLGAGLGLDLVFSGLHAARTGNLRRFAIRTAVLAAPFLLACGWWFVLPFPAGADVAASHRSAFLEFLGGNTQLATTPYDRRLWDAATFFAPGPRVLLLWLVGAAVACRHATRPGTRVLVCVLLVGYGPILAHNFHLDRFLLGPAAALWGLAAIGLAQLLPRANRLALPIALALLAQAVLVPSFDARLLADGLGLRTEANATYVDQLHAERLSLSPSRSLPTAGLRRLEHDGLLDLLATHVGRAERVAWLGINSELSPGALHLGLLARGGDPERFRRDSGRVRADGEPAMVVTFQSADPGWTPDQLRAWAADFDVVLSTEPIDWKGRRGREFLSAYRNWLFETGAWTYERLASFEIARAVGEPTEVELYACRRNGN